MKFLQLGFLCWLMTVCVACSSATDGGGTTVANPPSLPESSFSPDFDSAVPETSVESDASTDLSAFLSGPSASAELSGPASFWNTTILEGSFAMNRALRRAFERYALAIGEAVNGEAGFELSEDLRVITIRNQILFGVTGDWRIYVGTRDADNVRVVIRDSEDRIWGYYLFETDVDGNPIRGSFAFANVDAIVDGDSTATLRFFTLSYDVTEASDSRLSLTSERYDVDLLRTIFQQSFYQCDSTEGNCVAELLKITSAQPLREFSARSVRLSWSEADHQVCLATIGYDTAAQLGETQSFTGPNEPGDSDVTSGQCEIPASYWSNQIYSPDDFPNRLNDDSDGGFAVQLFGDSLLTNWESILTDSSTDDWLTGRF
jgi:hypothetical protein